jgi:hypothetical protein
MRIASLILVAGSLTACVVDGDDATQGGNGKADGNGSCTVPEYGDGTCQIDIACDIPDVDCYTPFDNDDAAAAWLTTQMEYTRITAPDPRVAKARMLVDRAYELFKSRVQLGSMADKPISMVVLEGNANAFVLGDYMTHKGGWSVQVQTGILDGRLPDDQIIGIMEHELTHLAKLHFIPEVKDRVRKFYVAPDGKEPIGESAAENPIAKQYGDDWRKSAILVGLHSNPELGNFPLWGQLGDAFSWYIADVVSARCPTQSEAYRNAYASITAGMSQFDQSLKVEATLAPTLEAAVDGLLQCNATDPQTLRGYLDSQSPEWIPYLQPYLTPDDVQQLDKPILQAITTIVGNRRAKMFAAEASFAKETARPWTALRYYSYEEAADDGWVRILQSDHQDGAANLKGAFMFFLDTQALTCAQALIANTVPYGTNLSDEHHGVCWRIQHAAQVATPGTTTARTIDDEPRIPHEPRHIPQRPGANPIY